MKLLIFFVILLMIGIPTGIYCYRFAGNGLSNKSEDWANFSIYLSIFVALCNLLLFALLTVFIHHYNSTRDRNLLLLERPVVSFYLNQQEGNFYVHNVGKGPAINIIIKSDLLNGAMWKYAFHWYSIPSNEPGRRMSWTGNSMEICATYSDAIGNEYLSYMDYNTLRIIDCSEKKSVNNHLNDFTKAKLPSQHKPSWEVPE